jgi:hypothetical protein
MVKVMRAYDLVTGQHAFSVVADDKKFAYVFEDKNNTVFNPDKRAKMLMSKIDEGKTLSAEYLLSIARFNLSSFTFSKPIEEKDVKTAIAAERVALRRSRENMDDSAFATDPKTHDEIDQVFADYPDLYDQLSSEDPEQKITAPGMTELVFAALGSIDPNGPYGYILDYLDKDNEEPVVAAAQEDSCPPATQDIELNLKNRQNAIDNVGYGPLNPQEPNEEFWQEKATRWSVPVEDAKKSTCGNCAAFIVTSRMKDCIAKGLQQGDENVEDSYDVVVQGELGYCEALDFKCAASRTCDAWITGGPVTDETGKE